MVFRTSSGSISSTRCVGFAVTSQASSNAQASPATSCHSLPGVANIVKRDLFCCASYQKKKEIKRKNVFGLPLKAHFKNSGKGPRAESRQRIVKFQAKRMERNSMIEKKKKRGAKRRAKIVDDPLKYCTEYVASSFEKNTSELEKNGFQDAIARALVIEMMLFHLETVKNHSILSKYVQINMATNNQSLNNGYSSVFHCVSHTLTGSALSFKQNGKHWQIRWKTLAMMNLLSASWKRNPVMRMRMASAFEIASTLTWGQKKHGTVHPRNSAWMCLDMACIS